MEGYVAVLLTRHTDHEREIAKLLTETDYHTVLENRKKEQQTIESKQEVDGQKDVDSAPIINVTLTDA